VGEIMRDLTDSLERENDLKEQLKFSEEEIKMIRKKLSDLEDENESVNLQLHKLSTARTKYSTKKPGEPTEVITEREHELRLQMELAEQEVHSIYCLSNTCTNIANQFHTLPLPCLHVLSVDRGQPCDDPSGIETL